LENQIKNKIKELDLGKNFFVKELKDGYQYLQAFDIYVISSVKEGLPYTLLEAMSASLPIIATNVGGIPEVLHKSGILIEPKNPNLLAENIIMLAQDKNLAQSLGDKARQKVTSDFSLKKMIEETKKVYQN
jgi:glycosyltransferase involved in cell wall biosynthesis